MDTNGTCKVRYVVEDASDRLKTYSIAFVVLSWTLGSIALITWVTRRYVPYLEARRLPLVLISFIGWFFIIIAFPVGRIAGSDMNCVVKAEAYLTAYIITIWPLVVRQILWRNKVSFNFKITKAVASKGLYAMDVGSIDLDTAKFVASNSYGILLVLLVFVPWIVVSILISKFYLCVSCGDFLLNPTTLSIFLTCMACLLAGEIVLIYTTWKVPDVVNLRRESIVAFAFYCIASFGQIFQYADVGGFQQQSPQAFDWSILIEWSFFLGFIYSVIILPVLKSFRYKSSRTDNHSVREFRKLLKSKRGLAFFEFYSTMEFSVENVLFYKAVTEYKNNYTPEGENTKKRAEQIVEKFIKPGSFFELNISHDCRLEVLTSFEDEEKHPRVDVFSSAEYEVFYLMYHDSYSHFLQSDFYRLYIGEPSEEKGSVIQSFGSKALLALTP